VSALFADKGVRVVYEDTLLTECPLWRRSLFSLPGGLAFSRPLLLDAQRSTFSDDGAELINQIPDLRRLWLWESQVSNTGLAALPPLSRLESFSAPESATEQGLVCLTRFPSLKSLQLVKADLSPKVVDWILRMNKLSDLDLRGSTIDPKHVERLRKSNQHLRIHI
jgi:hypothetical protein